MLSNPAIDNELRSKTVSIDATTTSSANVKGGNVTHYLVKQTRVLLDVKDPSFSEGNLLGSSHCPAQFRVSFELTVTSAISDMDNYYNLVYITPRRVDTAEEKPRHLLISLKANKFHISQSFESNGNFVAVNSKRTINKFIGRTVSVIVWQDKCKFIILQWYW
jgi:hypothetical protein